MKVKEESEKVGLKLNIQKTNMASGPITSWEIDGETVETVSDFIFGGHYPANYGFIPKTYSDDSDPLDVLVLCQSEIVPLCLVKCRPIGVFKMIDDDEGDEKIIAVPVNDPSWNMYNNIDQLPEHILDEMRHFFRVYKELEGKKTTIVETRGPKEAERIIKEAIERYREVFNK